MFNILKSIKNIFIHIRNSLKIIFLLIIGTALIVGILSLVYKPMYSVTLNGEFIGYTENKSNLQNKINEYMINGEEENIAFVDMQTLPEYSLCLLKKSKQSNEEEILNKLKSLGKVYYQYYAIVEGTTEKYYVSSKEEAEDIINQLKTKKSSNINNLAYTQVHNTEKKEIASKETVVNALYTKTKQKTVVASSYKTYNGTRIANAEIASSSVLGVDLVAPVKGVITSRFGQRGREKHTGLDIAAPTGTTIASSTSGTVVYAGNAGTGFGNFIKISSGNGVEMVYAHCSSIYVNVGQTVSQGEAIGAVGSTGNSTGSHLHLEIRLNGTAVNPQSYLY